MELRNNDEHRRVLQRLGIDRRPITGYTGEEWKKILKDPSLWCSLAPDCPRRDRTIRSMQGFAMIYERMSGSSSESDGPDDGKKAREFGEFVLAWGKELVAWCEQSRESFYLNVLVTHAWRWHGINDYASYAMEKINSMMKKTKRRYSFEKKSTAASRPAGRALVAMVRETNAANVLLQYSPLPQPVARTTEC
jgi:hypothetical protein